MCMSRAAGPAFVRCGSFHFKPGVKGVNPVLNSSIFALSIDHNLLGGCLWVVIMVLISLGGIYQSARIAKALES